MQCDDVAALLPGLVDGDRRRSLGRSATSRRACAARPSSPATGELLRTLALLRTRYAGADAGTARRDAGRVDRRRRTKALAALAVGPAARVRRRDRRHCGRRAAPPPRC